MGRNDDVERRGLKPFIDPEFASAKKSLAGFSCDDLLHLAARDWVRNIHLKNLLAQAEEKSAGLDDAQRLKLYRDVIGEAVKMVNELGNTFINEGKKQQRRETASAGGQAGRKAQIAAKNVIHTEWKARYGTPGFIQEKFARDMCDKYPCIKSHQTIEGWCRGWRRQGGNLG